MEFPEQVQLVKTYDGNVQQVHEDAALGITTISLMAPDGQWRQSWATKFIPGQTFASYEDLRIAALSVQDPKLIEAEPKPVAKKVGGR